MKILITGMTSQQANPNSTKRGKNFTGLLVHALQEAGHQVDWRSPSIETTKGELGRYDSVIVGVAPITSLGANRAYGALSTIWHLWEDHRLTLLVDGPDPRKIRGSLLAIQKKPENITKRFFSYRLEYEAAAEPRNTARLLDAAELLRDDAWPMTVGPRLPWQRITEMKGLLDPSPNVHLINLDRYVFDEAAAPPPPAATRHPVWAYETGTAHRWLRTQNVTWETGSIGKNVRANADKIATEQLRQVSGCLIAPTRFGTWWNTRYAQALSQGAPVFTDWTESSELGPEWSQLPGQFETWGHAHRQALGRAQLDSYRSAIDVQDKVKDLEFAITSGRVS